MCLYHSVKRSLKRDLNEITKQRFVRALTFRELLSMSLYFLSLDIEMNGTEDNFVAEKKSPFIYYRNLTLFLCWIVHLVLAQLSRGKRGYWFGFEKQWSAKHNIWNFFVCVIDNFLAWRKRIRENIGSWNEHTQLPPSLTTFIS